MKLSPEQLETFDREGYLFLPGVFSEAETALLRDEAHRDFTPIAPLADDCLGELLAAGRAAE